MKAVPMNENPQEAAPDCPLCGTRMQHRRRDPLARMFGMLVLYASCLVFLIILPGITRETILTLALFAVWGVYLMRGGSSLWCPGCWYEKQAGEGVT